MPNLTGLLYYFQYQMLYVLLVVYLTRRKYGRAVYLLTNCSEVITKIKVASLTIQPTKHDVIGMPLYRMYPYLIRSSMLWLAIYTFVLFVNTISKIILESFEKFC